MELLKLYTALLRRRWLVIQAAVLFTAVGITLALVLPKNYQASSRVLVSSSDTTMSILSDLGLSEVAAGLNNSTDDITNKIQEALTRPLIDEVIWRLQLRDDDGRLYNSEELLVPGLTGELEARPNIAISQQQGTDILVFEARADDPELARLLADTMVRVTITSAHDGAQGETRNARIFIEEQLNIVRSEFDRALKEIATAKADESVIDLESEMKAAIARLSELMLTYEENAAAIQDVRAQLYEAKAYQSRETVEVVSPSTANSNARVAKLRERLSELRVERTSELLDKTESHPDIARIDELIVTAEGELLSALEEQHALNPAIHQLESKLRGLVERGQEIDAAIQRTTSQFGGYPDKLRRLAQLQLTATAAESVYQSLQEQRYQVGVAEAMTVSDLQLIEPAKAPEKHTSPKLLVNAILGLGLGVMTGLALALVFEHIDDTIKNPEGLEEVWPLLRLGVIPRFKIVGDRRVIDTLSSTHPVAEGYRTIRNGLVYASLDKPISLIAVSSALPSEGKTTFAVNLSISFASEGKRVLLVDCDLRRPAQHRHFSSTSNHIGLTDVLTRRVQVSEAMQSTPVNGLTLLTSGPIPTDPARLVESLRLRQILLDLRKQFDVVIVDTPPSLVVNDALVIARAVDGIVLVVEAGRTSSKLVTEMRHRFESAAIDPVGLVLNKLDFYTSGYGSYYRKAYAHYGMNDSTGSGDDSRTGETRTDKPRTGAGGAA